MSCAVNLFILAVASKSSTINIYFTRRKIELRFLLLYMMRNTDDEPFFLNSVTS